MLPRLSCFHLSYLLLSLLEISFLHDVKNMDTQAVLLTERVLSPWLPCKKPWKDSDWQWFSAGAHPQTNQQGPWGLFPGYRHPCKPNQGQCREGKIIYTCYKDTFLSGCGIVSILIMAFTECRW